MHRRPSVPHRPARVFRLTTPGGRQARTPLRYRCPYTANGALVTAPRRIFRAVACVPDSPANVHLDVEGGGRRAFEAPHVDRRSFLRAGLAATGAVALGPDLFRRALAAAAQPGPGPYGSLTGITPDANGLILPPGFTSRIVARADQKPVPSSSYVWHRDPDGGAVFATPDGGWVYASNKEYRLDFTGGGAGALRFDRDGNVVDAYNLFPPGSFPPGSFPGTYTN